MSFYTANGDIFENFSDGDTSVAKSTLNLEENLNKNIYSHLKLSNSSENIIVYPIYPKQLKGKGIFLLSMERHIKKVISSSDRNTINYKDNNKQVRYLNLFQKFRLNNDKLEVKVNDTYEKVILENGILKQGKGELKVHKFLYSKSGFEVRLYDIKNKNKINSVLYKVNKKRDIFYLATNSEKTRFLKIVGNKNIDVNNKNLASKFSLHQINKTFKLDVLIPNENENLDIQNKAKSELIILKLSQKYNLVMIDNENKCKALKINESNTLVEDNSYKLSDNCSIESNENVPYRLLIALRR